MNNINWKSRTTQRGAVWIITALIASIGYFMDKDITPVLLIGTTVAGGLGFKVKE